MLSLRQNRRVALAALVLLLSQGSSLGWAVSQTGERQYSVVVRADSPTREIRLRDLGIAIEGHQGSINAVQDVAQVSRSIALVVDAGPNQSAVLGREKEVASSLILELSDKKTEFILIRAGFQTTTLVTGAAGSVAAHSLEGMCAEAGKKSQIPIYKAMVLAMEELSLRPGIRVLVVIAEGNDSKSGISYQQLRAAAQAQHVAVMTVLVADHSARGSKSILRYGWDLRSLASDTGAIFLDNDRNTSRTLKRLTEAIRSLRLVTFEIDGVSLGRHRMHISSNSVGRLHAQKAVFSEGVDCEQQCC